MTATMRLGYFAIALPYAAVLLGLYVLRNAWAAILLYHAGMLVLLRLGGQGGLLRAVRQGWSAPAAVTTGIVCATGSFLLALLWGTISREHVDLAEALTSLHLSGIYWWVFAAYYVTVHPVLEEIFWRNYLPRVLIDLWWCLMSPSQGTTCSSCVSSSSCRGFWSRSACCGLPPGAGAD